MTSLLGPQQQLGSQVLRNAIGALAEMETERCLVIYCIRAKPAPKVQIIVAIVFFIVQLRRMYTICAQSPRKFIESFISPLSLVIILS